MIKNPRAYWAAALVIFILSIYPLYMGIVVLKDYFAYGMVDASNYPNYIIPYTPICISLLISTALSPMVSKLFKRTGYLVTIILSFALFFASELLFEDITVFSPSGEGNIGSWQMYLCAATPEIPVTSYELLLGDYSPAFKLHFYLISLVIILSVNNCVWSFSQTDLESRPKKKKMLFMQLWFVTAFVGLCVLACFTAFFRKGTLLISPVSGFLMTVFFVVFGLTAGIFLGSLVIARNRKSAVFISVLGAVLTTVFMYIGELILLGGKLYQFGRGAFFLPLGSTPFAAMDLFIILLSGVITFLLAWYG